MKDNTSYLNDGHHTANLLDEILDLSLELIAELSHCEVIGIRLEVESDYPFIRHRGYSEDFLEKENFLKSNSSEGEFLACLCGNAIEKNCLHVFNSPPERNELITAFRGYRGECLERMACKSLALVPIQPNGRVVGLFHIGDRFPNRIRDEFIDKLREWGKRIAFLYFARNRLISRVSKKILIVDDEPVLRELFSKFFGREGHAVETADSARSALATVEQKKFDIVLTDYEMEGMNGIELACEFSRRLGAYRPRIFLVSGSAINFNMELLKKAGIIGFYSKPIRNITEFVKKVVDSDGT